MWRGGPCSLHQAHKIQSVGQGQSPLKYRLQLEQKTRHTYITDRITRCNLFLLKENIPYRKKYSYDEETGNRVTILHTTVQSDLQTI